MLKLSLIQFTAFSQSCSCLLQAISASAAWYGAVDVRLYQTVDDHNVDLATGRCDAILADVGSIIDFIESDGGVDVAFTGPTFSGGVFGDGVGGAIRKEDTDILEMWNKVIAEMSADGTTANITKKWFGRDISM